MSLAVAVPLGVASSLVYGSTIVVQHRASHNEGQEDARGLLRLFRDPVWVAAVGWATSSVSCSTLPRSRRDRWW